MRNSIFMFMSVGTSLFMSKSRNGVIAIPTIKTNNPINLYTLLYICISVDIVSVSSSAIGLYMLKIIAFDIPSSDRFNTCNMAVNRLFSPR